MFGAITAAGSIAVLLTSQIAMHQLKVGGPLYDKIKLGNDLIADVFPPPAYVIESFLEATLAMVDVRTLAERRSRIEELRKSYDERKAYWKDSDLDAPLKRLLVERSDVEVQKSRQVQQSRQISDQAVAQAQNTNQRIEALS